jgi:hypothetical protein
MLSFTVHILKLEGSRPRRNPTRPSTVHRFLIRFERAVRGGAIEMSVAAQGEAWSDFGLDSAGVRAVLAALSPADFHHDEPSTRDPGQTLWIFTPQIKVPPSTTYRAWIRIRETPGWYVVSFHRSLHG